MSKHSAATLALAKKNGKLPKKPRKPKKSASLTALESYAQRLKAWDHKVSEMAKATKKREALLKKLKV